MSSFFRIISSAVVDPFKKDLDQITDPAVIKGSRSDHRSLQKDLDPDLDPDLEPKRI